MDEYYCPNCGAILNNQLGFDPENGSWTCAECGKHLMDDDVYEGDSYKGLAWYCDNCGALLNRQSGFSDTCGSWTCTECYHTNSINEDEIINKEEKHECPNCGSILENQFLYADYEDDWECTDCGAKLHRCFRSDPYEVVYENDSDSDDNSDNYIYENNNESLGSTISNFANAMYAKVQAEEAQAQHEREIERRSEKQRRRAWRQKHKKGLRIFYLLIFIFIVLSISYYEVKQLTQVGQSSNEMIGEDYSLVINLLKQKGFKYVTVQPIEDLVTGEEDELDKIESVKIGFLETFSEDIKIPANVPIIITYHTYLTIGTPYSAKEAKKQSYEDVANAFKKKGFTNINFEVEYDILTGWITKEGDIEKITIDGNEKFVNDEQYRPDSEIVIIYHDWKKNKSK